MQKLEDAAWEVVATQFIGDLAWRRKYLKGGDKKLTRKAIDRLREHVVCGCNFPPSQFHLHIQYMLMPLIPYQYRMYKEGAHYTQKRFFPLAYTDGIGAKEFEHAIS